MHIVVGHVYTRIIGPYPPHIVDPVTSYFVDGAWFSPKFREGHWSGKVSYLKKVRGKDEWTVPSGLTPRIIRALSNVGWRFTMEDNRDLEMPEACYELETETGTLRLNEGMYDYQGQVLDSALAFSRGILQVPTGGGKTEIGAGIIKSYGKRTIWLTSKLTLLYQTAKRLQLRLGKDVRVGLVGDGIKQTDCQVTIAMVQSLGSVVQYFQDVEVVIGDEIHHLESEQWYESFGKLPAPYRFGLSATPHLEGAGMSLVAMCGPVIAQVPIQDLIARGVLVQPRIWIVKVPEPKSKTAKWPTAYAECIVNNTYRNSRIIQVCKTFKEVKKPALLLTMRISHGEMLADLLAHAGVNATFISGSMSADQRQAAVLALQEGRLDCIVSMAAIMGEGTDLPFLQAVINATGSRGGGNAEAGDSGRGTIQFIGRGTRRYPGKANFDYVDFADTMHKSMKGASKDRIETLEHEGYSQFMRYWEEYEPQ